MYYKSQRMQSQPGRCVCFDHSTDTRILIKFEIFKQDLYKKDPRFSYQYMELDEQFERNSVRTRMKKHVKNSYFYIVNKQHFYTQTNFRYNQPKQVLQFIAQHINSFVCSTQGLQLKQHNFTNNSQAFKFEYDPILILFLALGAAKIIERIKKGNFRRMEQQIQNFWMNNGHFDIESLNWIARRTNKDYECIQYAQRQAKNILKGMFNFSQQRFSYFYDPQIFDQDRFASGSINKNRFVFLITNTTRQIFHAMDIYKTNQYKHNQAHHLYLHGLGGIGKSVSTSLLVGLHNYIDKLRYNLLESQYRDIVQDPQVPWDIICQYPKYIYFSLNSSYNMRPFYKAVRKQIPYELQIQQLEDSSLVRRIGKSYGEKKLKIIYIIDQINIFCSLARKKKEGNQHIKKQFNQTQYLLSSLKDYDVVFNSSQNAQKQTLKDLFYQYSLLQKKIVYQKRFFYDKQIEEIIDIIRFQYSNQKAKIDTPINEIFQIQNFFQIIFNQNLNDLRQDLCYLSELTHLRIKISLQQILKQNSLLLNQYNYLDFFKSIYQKSIYLLQKKYQKFMEKGQIYQKFKLLHQLIKWATEARENRPNQNNFTAYLRQDVAIQNFQNAEQLFKQLAQVINRRQIQIYTFPQTFLRITRFVDEKVSYTLQYAQQFLKPHLFDPVLVGRMVDSTFINLLSKQDMTIFIGEHFNIKYFKSIQSKFIGFWSLLSTKQIQMQEILQSQCQISKKTSVYMRFCHFFQIFNQQRDLPKLPPTFLCGIPKKINEQHHTNSQCIDFLLIKHDIDFTLRDKFFQSNQHFYSTRSTKNLYQDYSDKYTLYTFDFSVTFTDQYIKKKIKKAQLFFDKFLLVCQNENSRHQDAAVNKIIDFLKQYKKMNYPSKKVKYSFKKIIHTFIVPQKMATKRNNQQIEKKTYKTHIKFQFFPIQKVIIFNENSFYSDNNKILLETLQVLKQAIHIRANSMCEMDE